MPLAFFLNFTQQGGNIKSPSHTFLNFSLIELARVWRKEDGKREKEEVYICWSGLEMTLHVLITGVDSALEQSFVDRNDELSLCDYCGCHIQDNSVLKNRLMAILCRVQKSLVCRRSNLRWRMRVCRTILQILLITGRKARNGANEVPYLHVAQRRRNTK